MDLAVVILPRENTSIAMMNNIVNGVVQHRTGLVVVILLLGNINMDQGPISASGVVRPLMEVAVATAQQGCTRNREHSKVRNSLSIQWTK